MKIIVSFGEVKDGNDLATKLIGNVDGVIENVAPPYPWNQRELHITPSDMANAKKVLRIVAKHLL